MKKSKFTEQQIAFALQHAEGGTNVTDCAMRSHFVVLSSPFFDFFTGVVLIQEPVPAETFQSHGGG